MPRIARLHVPAVVHHVISRFVNSEFVIADEFVRAEYLWRIGEALARSSWQLLAYAVMSNHPHLCLWAGAEPLHSWIQGAHSGFASWVQRRRRQAGLGARGPVFADRPTTVLVEPDRAAYLIAYLHNNPVRAGVVPQAAESTWTSHRAYLGLAVPPSFLHVDRGLELCGVGSDSRGRRAFDAMVCAHAGLGRDPDLTAAQTSELSARVRALAGTGAQLGSPSLGPEGLRYPLVQAALAPTRPAFVGPAMEVVELVAKLTGVSVVSIRSRGRTERAVEARMVAAEAWARLGRRPSEIATAVGLSRSAVSKALGRAGRIDRTDALVEAVLEKVVR